MVSEKAMAELRGLSAGWRKEAQAEWRSFDEEAPVRAGVRECCADELDAALDNLSSARALEQPEGREAVAFAWRHPDEVPDVPAGGSAYLWVAVKRNGDGRVYSFPAQYLNAMLLCDEWGDGAERSGNRYQYGPVDEDDGSFPATGWHSAKEHGEYESVYQPLLSDGDELVAWCKVPSYPATTPPAKGPDGARVMPGQRAALGDMGEGTRLSIYRQEDGDLIVSVIEPGMRFNPVSVEFCTPGGGGGKNSALYWALSEAHSAMPAFDIAAAQQPKDGA